MELVENAKHEMTVTFGRTWYKLVGVSVALGAAVAAGTFMTGRMVFAETFANTKIVTR